jgi:hypothetical protein
MDIDEDMLNCDKHPDAVLELLVLLRSIEEYIEQLKQQSKESNT